MNKYVIYFAGGSMRGVFGAGVATAFERDNFYPNISAVYGASAGAMTGAYFLARQGNVGPSIYWENLDSGFVKSKTNFLIGTWQRFQDKFVKKVKSDKIRDALDLEYVMDVIKNKKRLVIEKIIEGNTPLNVKFFNLDNHEIEYIDVRRLDILEILIAGIKVFPYAHEVSIIDGKRLIDGAVMDIIGIDFLKKKHPNEKIIIVMNGQIDRKFRYRLKNILEGKFMEWMFNDPTLYSLHASAEDKLAKDLEIIKSDPNILLITPDRDVLVRSRTTDANLLLQMYNLGIKAGQRSLSSLL